jgi:hypothetical protein
MFTGHLAAGDVLLEICHAVRALPPPRGAPRPLDLLLDGLALLTTDGRATATPVLQRAVKALADLPVEDVLRWGLASAASIVWDDEGWHAIAARQAQIFRDAGALAKLPTELATLAIVSAWIGDFATAASLAVESDSVAATATEQAR